ncbi:peripherin-2-like [Bombyx mandarina]|uniref:Peripherin-2-like n=2 Tax=Bombyx TaxID=7090 RepID=A0A8R1WLQ1_BOMMO|nr:peripherin-2 [Bombyx mori]XP_021205843.1 peripherin-2 [Bombyx mori]XP_028030892.1 peripherin-2-like [Bombyx mandarina]
MAQFRLSKEGRERVAAVLRALLIAQLVVSLCMVIFCYNTTQKVMMLLKNVHKLTVYLLCGLVLLQTYCMKLHYTAGLRLVTLLLRCPFWSRGSRVGKIWLINGLMLVANGGLVYAACRATLKALVKELSSSLRVGMSQYLIEPSWKKLLDTMQVDLCCCGADRPGDWHEIPWLSVDFLNENSSVVMKLAGTDGKILPPVSPYSCCTPRVLAPCYHDPLQQWSDTTAWRASPLVAASLHTRGCVEAVRAPLVRALLALQFFNILILIFQVLIILLIQLLSTSARAAALRGECGGAGRGSLFGTPAPAPSVDPERRVVAGCTWNVGGGRRAAVRARSSYPYLS